MSEQIMELPVNTMKAAHKIKVRDFKAENRKARRFEMALRKSKWRKMNPKCNEVATAYKNPTISTEIG